MHFEALGKPALTPATGLNGRVATEAVLYMGAVKLRGTFTHSNKTIAESGQHNANSPTVQKSCSLRNEATRWDSAAWSSSNSSVCPAIGQGVRTSPCRLAPWVSYCIALRRLVLS